MADQNAELGTPRRHLPGCILAPDHAAGCVREQYATDDPTALWNMRKSPEK